MLIVRDGNEEVARVGLEVGAEHLVVTIDAAYRGNAAPPGEPRWLDGLWEHEVVEVFIVGAPFSDTAPYVELELSPHGHWLSLRFDGYRKRAGDVDVDVDVRADGVRWRGQMRVALGALPPRPWRVNACAIHEVGGERRHLSATVLGGERPDFHRVWELPEGSLLR